MNEPFKWYLIQVGLAPMTALARSKNEVVSILQARFKSDFQHWIHEPNSIDSIIWKEERKLVPRIMN